MDNFLGNYVDDVTLFNDFKQDCSKELAVQAEKAKNNLNGYYGDDIDFVVIEVEGYYCVAILCSNELPYEIGEIVAPFDKDHIYPIQKLITKFAFKRY